MDKSQLIEEAIEALRELKVSEEQLNKRSAMTLLALLHLKPGDDWGSASNPMLRVRDIMDWIRDFFDVDYKPNTREAIRRFTLHQFVIAELAEENADEPGRPVNSPKWNYRITEEALNVFRNRGKSVFEEVAAEFITEHKSYKSLAEERRNMPKVSVTLPSGAEFCLSAGGQSVLIKAIIEEMLPRFVPGSSVVYIDDADHKHGIVDRQLADKLGIVLSERGKAPDVIAWDCERGWIFLMEAAETHRPVDVTRKHELRELFAKQWDKVVLISCFPSRKTMRKYLAALAWETEAWCADSPDHMMHFDGSRFMGPYGD